MISGRKPVLLAWSGGKDSCMALHELQHSLDFEVVGLLTTVTEEYERISMHGVRRSLLEAQAAAIGLPLTVVTIPPAAGNETYDERMGAALASAREAGIGTVAFGDLYLQEIRDYREQMLARAGMSGIFPLWGRPTRELAESFISEGFRAVLTCVDTSQIDAIFAGRDFDRALLATFPSSADPCGENGEFHTFVYSGPVLSAPLNISTGDRVLRDDRFMYCDIFSLSAASAE